MQRSFPNFQTILKGGIITFGLVVLLSWGNLIIVNATQVSQTLYFLINGICVLTCWVLLAYLIQKVSIYKILGVIGLIVAAILAERYLDIEHNPFTIPLIILFWISLGYLLLPQFFLKYRIAILMVYGLVISYYFFLFITTAQNTPDHRLNFANIMLVPIPLFFSLWVYEQWRWLKTLQTEKSNAELALLKSQINPHFFFNTLNNLYGLVVEKSEQAPDVVLKLSEMMRYTIYQGKEQVVKLSDEVQYLNAYIDLHRLRHQQDVDIQFIQDIKQEVEIAPLLFINLLENAFKHGVASKTANAYTHIQLIVKKNQINFDIKNNYEVRSSQGQPGIGLDNLRQRLEHIYPNRHEFQIVKTHDTFSVRLQIDLGS